MTFSKHIVKKYNKTRISADKSILCHAPFQSINFTQNGDATVCCYNKKYVLGTYPIDSIKDLWFGKVANKLRHEMKIAPLPEGCHHCVMQIQSKNYAAAHSRHYDLNSDHPIKHLVKKGVNYLRTGIFTAYPRVIEFELSNTCNLECIMCNGYFSSSIKKNREKSAPMKMVFDDAFIEQLTEFIPYLTDAKFLGGEPFLIPIYFKIWEKIKHLNPNCKLTITTNATIISEKAWEILNTSKSDIVVSIDSMQSNTYNKIRQGAVWEDVYSNIKKLHAYTLQKKTFLSFSICPITVNWKEMPDIIQYGIDNKICIYFNTVLFPKELSLKHVEHFMAVEIVDFYNLFQYKGSGFFYEYNTKQIKGLTNMIKYWHLI